MKQIRYKQPLLLTTSSHYSSLTVPHYQTYLSVQATLHFVIHRTTVFFLAVNFVFTALLYHLHLNYAYHRYCRRLIPFQRQHGLLPLYSCPIKHVFQLSQVLYLLFRTPRCTINWLTKKNSVPCTWPGQLLYFRTRLYRGLFIAWSKRSSVLASHADKSRCRLIVWWKWRMWKYQNI